MTDFDPLFGSKLMVRKGIWLKCVRVSPGVHNCDAYLHAINEIPMFLMWSRVNSILGLVLISLSHMLVNSGLTSWSRALQQQEKKKKGCFSGKTICIHFRAMQIQSQWIQ